LTKCTYVDVKEIEKIFKDVAGSEDEIGWEKLKKVLDSTIPKGLIQQLKFNTLDSN
jgi:hypothetical protein